mmetsp:Transcript_6102/g.17073  ORF Transcript_6102/g.17073 Transcript_6102/m.17073 type:complete len:335 (-) Transcript_6102:246-1250(-)
MFFLGPQSFELRLQGSIAHFKLGYSVLEFVHRGWLRGLRHWHLQNVRSDRRILRDGPLHQHQERFLRPRLTSNHGGDSTSDLGAYAMPLDEPPNSGSSGDSLGDSLQAVGTGVQDLLQRLTFANAHADGLVPGGATHASEHQIANACQRRHRVGSSTEGNSDHVHLSAGDGDQERQSVGAQAHSLHCACAKSVHVLQGATNLHANNVCGCVARQVVAVEDRGGLLRGLLVAGCDDTPTGIHVHELLRKGGAAHEGHRLRASKDARHDLCHRLQRLAVQTFRCRNEQSFGWNEWYQWLQEGICALHRDRVHDERHLFKRLLSRCRGRKQGRQFEL